nr:unnamed protein product [Callosobruchus chinensis]
MAIRLIGDPALTCHLQPLSHRRAVGDLSLFYRYSNGFCYSELSSIIPPLSEPARYTRGTSSSSHPNAVVLHTARTEQFDHTFFLGCLGSGMDCLVMHLLILRMPAYSSPASTNFLAIAAAVLWYLGLAFAVCSVIKK